MSWFASCRAGDGSTGRVLPRGDDPAPVAVPELVPHPWWVWAWAEAGCTQDARRKSRTPRMGAAASRCEERPGATEAALPDTGVMEIMRAVGPARGTVSTGAGGGVAPWTPHMQIQTHATHTCMHTDTHSMQGTTTIHAPHTHAQTPHNKRSHTHAHTFPQPSETQIASCAPTDDGQVCTGTIQVQGVRCSVQCEVQGSQRGADSDGTTDDASGRELPPLAHGAPARLCCPPRMTRTMVIGHIAPAAVQTKQRVPEGKLAGPAARGGGRRRQSVTAVGVASSKADRAYGGGHARSGLRDPRGNHIAQRGRFCFWEGSNDDSARGEALQGGSDGRRWSRSNCQYLLRSRYIAEPPPGHPPHGTQEPGLVLCSPGHTLCVLTQALHGCG
jgi:hypothetical protein